MGFVVNYDWICSQSLYTKFWVDDEENRLLVERMIQRNNAGTVQFTGVFHDVICSCIGCITIDMGWAFWGSEKNERQ